MGICDILVAMTNVQYAQPKTAHMINGFVFLNKLGQMAYL